MNFIDYLKNIKNQLLNIQEHNEEEIVEKPSIPEIVIENHHSLFANEQEIIMKGAQTFLEGKKC